MKHTLIAAAAAFLTIVPALAGAQEAATLRVSGVRIEQTAWRALAVLPHDADEKYVAAAIIPDQIVNAGTVALHADAPIASGTFVNVPVAIDVDGKVARTVYVGYRMQQYVQTAVAARDLDPGTVLAADDLTMTRVPYMGRPGNGIDALVGRKVNGAVLKGQPVPIEATSVDQIVKPGSTVIFMVVDSGVVVTADVIARTGGGMGDEVSVYNPQTNKALSGRVIAPNTVELDISGGDAQ
jgi:flagella basal body P-ring formation protein FlgA